MYETIAIVGERGQITIPKTIRKVKGIRAKDEVIIGVEDGKIMVEKTSTKKEKEMLLKEYYSRYAGLHRRINKDWEVLDKEANRFLR